MTFDEKKEYIEKNSKLDITKFKNVEELTMMLDLLNTGIENKKEARAGEDIHEISKFLVRTMGRKFFFMK